MKIINNKVNNMNGLLYKSQAKKQMPNLVNNSGAMQTNAQAFNSVSNAVGTVSEISKIKNKSFIDSLFLYFIIRIQT